MILRVCPDCCDFHRKTGRCDACASSYEPVRKARERARSRYRLAHEPYRWITTGSRWPAARKAARRRDGDTCVYAATGGCRGRLEVHHIVPVRLGGAPYDLDNLVTACRAHHSRLEASYRRAEKRWANKTRTGALPP
jgi:5-methylcytosine-specific restriction endonuclease McrA